MLTPRKVFLVVQLTSLLEELVKKKILSDESFQQHILDCKTAMSLICFLSLDEILAPAIQMKDNERYFLQVFLFNVA